MDGPEDAVERETLADSPAKTSLREVAPKQSRGRLSKTVINFFLDAILLCIVVLIGCVAAILRFVFPAPTAAQGWTLWGWGYDAWSDFQFGCMCVLAGAILVHVMLHWSWVCSVLTAQILKTRQRIDDSMQTIYGVGLLIVLLHIILIVVIVAMYAVRKPPA
jgi:hypothetical protein